MSVYSAPLTKTILKPECQVVFGSSILRLHFCKLNISGFWTSVRICSPSEISSMHWKCQEISGMSKFPFDLMCGDVLHIGDIHFTFTRVNDSSLLLYTHWGGLAAVPPFTSIIHWWLVSLAPCCFLLLPFRK